MARSHRCPDCESEMEIGFVPDHYVRVIQSRWHPGTATNWTIIGNLKLDAKLMIPITTFRCSGCGLLKHYATEPAESQ